MRTLSRRTFFATTGAAGAATTLVPSFYLFSSSPTMYGLIGKIIATPGRRDELIEILLEGTADMPGCLSYVVAKDADDANAIWVTEVWESKNSHEASLSLPAVQQAIERGRPLIADFGERVETTPVGGHGLPPAQEG